MAVISELAVNVVAKTGGLEKGLAKGKKSFSSFKKTIAKGMAGLASGAGIKWVGKLAMDMETTRVRFETMMGSASEAKVLLDKLDTFAAKTPFKFDDLTQGAAHLMAFGIGADEVMGALQSLGDIAAGTPATLVQIVNVFGKVKAKGKASMEELNRLMEAGVPILDVLAKQYGKTKEEVMKMVSGGQVGFKDFEKAVFSMSAEGGMFFKMMDKQSKTLAGSISTLKDNFDKLGRQIGQALKTILDGIVVVVTAIVKWWNNLSKGFKDTVIIIGAMAVAFVVALKAATIFVGIVKAISVALAAQNAIAAFGSALLGNWVMLAAAGAAAAAVGFGMKKMLDKQNAALADVEKQTDKNTKAVDKELDKTKQVTAEEQKRLDLLKKQEEAMKSRAKSIADSVLTPMEQATKAMREVNELAAKGFLDAESAARKRAEISKNLLGSSKKDSAGIERERAIGAATFRSAGGFSAAQEARRAQRELKAIQEAQLAEQKRQTDLLEDLNENVADSELGLGGSVGP